MKKTIALALMTAFALAGCNTWNAAKQDAKEVGGTVSNAVGTGLDKAGDGLNTAGEKVKKVGK